MKYRDKTEIVAGILDVAQEGALKSKIMNGSLIKNPYLKSYLEFLREDGLLEYNSNTGLYRTTENGKRLLSIYRKLHSSLYVQEKARDGKMSPLMQSMA
jgi:predicted transcriptional regulator